MYPRGRQQLTLTVGSAVATSATAVQHHRPGTRTVPVHEQSFGRAAKTDYDPQMQVSHGGGPGLDRDCRQVAAYGLRLRGIKRLRFPF